MIVKTRADDLKIGDTIMPPAREIQLWMRRSLQERGLKESALHLTITEIREGIADKRGRWLFVSCDQTAEWNAGRKALPFRFKVRPETPWAKVEG
jgi:hypothetical protein